MKGLTPYHAKYFAYELTKRSAADSVEKLAGVLADAQVDLNPHQVEAALFAFRNPFSRGAILADEVGLGKTIEAGLLLSQKWAERKRRLLIILPANLRKQWNQELLDKFHLPSVVLENKSFNEAIRKGNLNPFAQDGIILCSYQFARSKEPYVRQVPWDLVVIDEAHRLRNVYKTSSRIALAIKQAVAPFPKVLLTATPLQNSLLELYGLVSIIDDYAFGDLKSFRSRFARLGNQADFAELKERLKPICKRTLRRQVLEFVAYTNRHALVQEFIPSADEQRLYDLVSDYLQSPTLYALPAGQRQLMTLILRKLLASSTYAISGTLEGLAQKLETAAAAAEAVKTPPDELPENLEEFDELADEWEEDEDEAAGTGAHSYTPEQLNELKAELQQLREFRQLAASIVKNSKGEVLLTALRRGFDAAQKAQAKDASATFQQKAIIFTESRRTQDYLFRILEQTEFKGKVMIFNGVNNDPGSKAIYQKWLAKHAGTDRVTCSPSADMRAALVENFRDEAAILIATEAAAEGVNLQFCNLVVNYDLPWNPQRIEQRIGRCHRYGQKFDVVVVNFLNKTNAADQRVYQLLDQKFQLFNGVFGASDEVLGAVESGVDFEKRIAAIYQKCRSPVQIQFEFDQLQKELETDIAEGQRDAREKLLDNFDQDVVEKVKVQSHTVLDRFNRQLWLTTRHILDGHAHFQDADFSFMLHDNPFSGETIHPGPYRIGKNVEDANTYRAGHPLAQRVLARAKAAGTQNPQLSAAFGLVRDWVNQQTLEEVTTFLYRLMNQAMIIRLDVSDAKDAFKLFETINNRGLRLSPTDIIKNFLLGNAGRFGVDPLRRGREAWARIIENLDGTNSDAFFRYYLMSMLCTRVTASEVVAQFKSVFMTQVKEAAGLPERHLYPDDPMPEEEEEAAERSEAALISADSLRLGKVSFNGFLERLVASAKVYGELVLAKTDDSRTNRHLRNLRMIKAVQTYGFLMHLRLGKCSDKVFRSILKLTESFVLRRHICRERANETEALFARLCGIDSSDPLPRTKEEYGELCPSDEKFRDEFATVSFPANLIDRARYCLEQLESARHGTHVELQVLGAEDVHVEHIIPQKIKTKKAKEEFGDWPNYLGASADVLHPKYVGRIGNLTLFAGSLNIGASNNPFGRKRAAYRESSILLTKEVGMLSSFKFRSVEKRGSELAAAAVRLWPRP